MPDVNYTITYVVNARGAVVALGQAGAGFKQFDAQVTASTNNLLRFQSLVNTVGGSLVALASKATAAGSALAGVGRGGNATAAATRLGKLKESIEAVAKAAEQAGPAMENLVPGGGGRGGGAAGARSPGGGGGGVLGGLASITRASAAYAGYRALRKVGGAAGEASADRREFYREAGKVAVDYQKDLQQLAVLQGKSAADDETIRGDLAFQKETNLSPEKSSTFRLEFGGAISPALKAVGKDGQPNITPQTAKDLEGKAAQLTARYDLDPTTGGRMAGLLGVTHKVPTAEAGMQTMSKALELLNVEGVGPVSGMATYMMALSGSMIEEGGGGRFKDYPQLAARLAASTVAESGSAARAKTRIEQSSKALRKIHEKDEGAFLKKAGITGDDDYETAIRKIEPLLRDKSGGLGGADTILSDAGFANATERKALIQEVGMNTIVSRSLADPGLDAKAARAGAMNAEYRDSIPGRRQAAENTDFAATINAGLAERRLETARLNQRARMTADDTLKAGPIGHLADMGLSLLGSAGGISGEDLRVDQGAIASLVERGGRAGVDVLGKYKQLDVGPRVLNQGDERSLATSYAAAEEEIEGKEKLAKSLEQAAAAARALGNGGGGQQPGDGGAGAVPMRR